MSHMDLTRAGLVVGATQYKIFREASSAIAAKEGGVVRLGGHFAAREQTDSNAKR
jgi:hypothetical protein